MYLWSRQSGAICPAPVSSFLCWLDDDRYLSADTEECAGWTALYAVCAQTGAKETALSVPLKLTAARWLGSDRWLLAAEYDQNAPDISGENGQSLLQSYQEAQKRFRVIEDIPFRIDGRGYISGLRQVLYTYHPAEGAQALTPRDMDVKLFELTADRSAVIFSARGPGAVRPPVDGLYRIDLRSRCMDVLAAETNLNISSLAVTERHTCFFAAVQGEDFPVTRAYHPGPGGEAPVCDAVLPCDTLDAKMQGGNILVLADWGCRGALLSIAPGGQPQVLTGERLSVSAFDARGDCILFTACEPAALPELYTLENGVCTRISSFNQQYLADRKLSLPQPFSFTGSGGVRIDGFVLYPQGYTAGKKYPGILEIHGGPRSLYAPSFDHEMQLLSAQGYFVFFCNPRGSSGRGREFPRLAMQDYGTYDYEDLMGFTDAVLNHFPDIDPHRLGVCGSSYGGYMAAWIIGQTDRFRAAVVQRPIANMVGFDLRTDFCARTRDYQYPDPVRMWNRSPVAHASNVKTPTLILQSEQDYRCPPNEGLELYCALRNAGVETRLILFHNEGHSMSRTGLPLNRTTRLEEILRWLNLHLTP